MDSGENKWTSRKNRDETTDQICAPIITAMKNRILLSTFFVFISICGFAQVITLSDTTAIPYVSDSNGVFHYAQVMPEFPGGSDSLNKFISKNIKYTGIGCKQGTVYISFIVEKDGTITNIKVIKEVPGAPEFTKEAIRVISMMPKWSPGKINDQAVRVEVKRPVRFTLY